jgi:hypothetical protein
MFINSTIWLAIAGVGYEFMYFVLFFFSNIMDCLPFHSSANGDSFKASYLFMLKKQVYQNFNGIMLSFCFFLLIL